MQKGVKHRRYTFNVDDFKKHGVVKRTPHVFMDGVESVSFNGQYIGFINVTVNPDLIITYSNSTYLLHKDLNKG